MAAKCEMLSFGVCAAWMKRRFIHMSSSRRHTHAKTALVNLVQFSVWSTFPFVKIFFIHLHFHPQFQTRSTNESFVKSYVITNFLWKLINTVILCSYFKLI